jgi:hypothetical protein
MQRLGGGERYLCLFNAGPRRARVQVGISGRPKDWVKVFEAAEVRFGGSGATLPETLSPRLTLGPFAAAIYKERRTAYEPLYLHPRPFTSRPGNPGWRRWRSGPAHRIMTELTITAECHADPGPASWTGTAYQ